MLFLYTNIEKSHKYITLGLFYKTNKNTIDREFKVIVFISWLVYGIDNTENISSLIKKEKN